MGNGHFAFGFDITGLQTFNPDANTLSEWGWHRFPLPAGSDPYHYRNHSSQETIDRWKDVVLQTADFLASYPFYKEQERRYILGYPLQVVSENADPHTTINPTSC